MLWKQQSRRLRRRLCDTGRENGSVANGDAGDIGALQRPADRFGLIALEAGEAGAEQLAVILGNDRLGEGIGLAEQAAGLIARQIDARAGFAFAFQRADLDDPAGVGDGGRGLDGAVLLDGLRLGIGERLRRGRDGTLEAGSTPSTPWPVP